MYNFNVDRFAAIIACIPHYGHMGVEPGAAGALAKDLNEVLEAFRAEVKAHGETIKLAPAVECGTCGWLTSRAHTDLEEGDYGFAIVIGHICEDCYKAKRQGACPVCVPREGGTDGDNLQFCEEHGNMPTLKTDEANGLEPCIVRNDNTNNDTTCL